MIIIKGTILNGEWIDNQLGIDINERNKNETLKDGMTINKKWFQRIHRLE
jgi:hypothetical protein